ncbi:DUF2390 domain-containing protein [Shewanella maritima]|uniref:DUF2390 domain-containing protein n=1 Tax=Shewanella maritima TaxID=2520507 RepID=UPI00373682AA
MSLSGQVLSRLLPQWHDAIWQLCEHTYLQQPSFYVDQQDNHQLNVNLLLLAQCLDNADIELSQAQWHSLIDAISNWDKQVLKPYRQARRQAKKQLGKPQYQQMLTVELTLEHQCQRLITLQLDKLLTPDEHEQLREFSINTNQLDQAKHLAKSQHNLQAYLACYQLAAEDLTR